MAVLGVLGGSGGVGASSFAAALAAAAAPAVLVDLDVAGGGIDVLLGIEREPGARWSGLRLAGGRLDPDTLVAGLARWAGCAVLAADTVELDAAAVGQVLETARDTGRTVVLDLPRHCCAARVAALAVCDLVVVLVRADVPGVVAAHAAVGDLPAAPAGAVVRRGPVPAADAARAVGVRLLGTLPALGSSPADLAGRRPPRGLTRVAGGLLAGAGPAEAGPAGEPAARR
ncbi:hypothetical protein [uncultured Jatrophihabitans sp.]|uniref:hypothetical protein n=1 Tax=uncultured Jatrophihabitans sp. TaxID=1610747 RepID=UPI0035CB9EAD